MSDRAQRLTLFCLPYAGASAAIYRAWPTHLPAWLELVPLHLPGRGVRYDLAPMHRWPELVDLLCADMRPSLERPFGIFGHSMGALIAFELAHAVRDRCGRSPAWLGVAACAAPTRRVGETDWLTCDEPVLIDELRALGAMPDALLGDRDFMDLISPALRADFHLCGTYARPPGAPLDCPILALGGAQDRTAAAGPGCIQAWSAETTDGFRAHTLPGGHFFIDTHRDALIETVVADIATRARPRARRHETARHACV